MSKTSYISWDDYFMGVAILSSFRSKDPNTKVGACIVNTNNRIIGIGYNGLPYGLNDQDFNWSNEGDYLNTKYPYVVHAEANAILNATTSVRDAKIYVTLFPCNECSKLIIQAGIKEIVYSSNKYENTKEHQAAIKMLNAAGVTIREFKQGELSYDRFTKTL